jgi:hypothetical protein
MKGIFSFFRSSAAKNQNPPKEIALICNFTSCPLGLNLHKQFSARMQTIGVAHNGSQYGGIDKFLNVQEDRDALISYLKHNNMIIKYLIFNQPFKLRPVVDDPINANSDDEKEENKVMEL